MEFKVFGNFGLFIVSILDIFIQISESHQKSFFHLYKHSSFFFKIHLIFPLLQIFFFHQSYFFLHFLHFTNFLYSILILESQQTNNGSILSGFQQNLLFFFIFLASYIYYCFLYKFLVKFLALKLKSFKKYFYYFN